MRGVRAKLVWPWKLAWPIFDSSKSALGASCWETCSCHGRALSLLLFVSPGEGNGNELSTDVLIKAFVYSLDKGKSNMKLKLKSC
jgi:hypothetical protein